MPRLVWAERIRPMSLNPGSVPILAKDLGMFESAGVDLEVREYLGSPGAVAALRSGEAAFAQLPTLEGVRLIAKLRWPGRIFWVNRAEKTSSVSGALMMAAPSIEEMGDLRGKRFGVGADGDYWAPIISKMLRMNGLRKDEIVWVKDLDPAQKADMLLGGRIDVILTSVQNYIGKLEGDPRAHVLASGEELAKYREGRPDVPSFVAVAGDATLREKETMERVTCVLIKAARLFSDDQDAWVGAASRRRPDVPKEKIRKLWRFFRGDFPVNGGLETSASEILKALRSGPGTRGFPPSRLFTEEFERTAIEELGSYKT